MSEKADVKSSRMQKGRKTINYLQKLKDEGTPSFRCARVRVISSGPWPLKWPMSISAA